MRRCAVLAIALLAAEAAAAEPPRVQAARARAGASVRRLFEAAGAAWPPRALLIRGFKQERELELWAEPSRSAAYVKVKTWPICSSSGTVGPKRREGDGQVPEGFYRISGFNPASAFHLSLRVDYPNRSDRIVGRPPLGGDIFIHGGCVTVGCLPLTDAGIDELYLIAADARANRAPLEVHLFPARLEDAGYARLTRAADPKLKAFWSQLREGYLRFETTKRPPRVGVGSDGRYFFADR